MGTETLPVATDGTIIPSSHVNTLSSVLKGDLVPRNSAGIPTDEDGSLGSDTHTWLKAFIKSGYWTIGDIKSHHTYNGTAPIGEGWMLCDGRIINEANYNTEHGAGAWATYVGSSNLDGKYLPNLTDKYIVGAATTTQTGTVAITSVGNSAHGADAQHSHSHNHQGDIHNHQWFQSNPGNTSGSNSWNSVGNVTAFDPNTSGNRDGTSNDPDFTAASGSNYTVTTFPDAWTDNQEPFTDSDATVGGSATQDVQPESIEAQIYMRII